MKSISSLIALFSLLLMFTACESETDLTKTNTSEKEHNGTFKIYMNDSLVREGTTDKVGLIQGLNAEYTNTVSLDNGTIVTMLISGLPYKTGNIVTLNEDGDDEAFITIGGWDIRHKDFEELYMSTSGTITRTSATRISFEGKCIDMSVINAPVFVSMDTISFRGYYESEAFENIK